jgi:hypothetical protein
MWDERRYFFKMLRNLQRKQDASPVVLQVTTDNQQVALFVSCDLQGHCLPEWPSKSSLLTEEKIAVQSYTAGIFTWDKLPARAKCNSKTKSSWDDVLRFFLWEDHS